MQTWFLKVASFIWYTQRTKNKVCFKGIRLLSKLCRAVRVTRSIHSTLGNNYCRATVVTPFLWPV